MGSEHKCPPTSMDDMKMYLVVNEWTVTSTGPANLLLTHDSAIFSLWFLELLELQELERADLLFCIGSSSWSSNSNWPN